MSLPMWKFEQLIIVYRLKGIFGRKKRYLDSVDIECMNRCDNDCWKLMTNNNTEMLSNGKPYFFSDA